MYLCRVKAKREFEVQEAARAEGIDCRIARQVTLARVGKARLPEIVERPYWPTYAFCVLDAAQFYQWRDIRYVSQPTVPVLPKERRRIEKALAANDLEAQKVRDELAAEERLSEFEPGDRVKINEGPFAGLFGRFIKAEKYQDAPRLTLEVEAFGQTTTMQAQPIHVKPAAE